jgi:nitrite reductase/ring-hydroxylating ferredoxin subunit
MVTGPGAERDVGALADLAPGSVRTVQVAGWRICLAHQDGEVFAVGDECRHRSGSLGHGRLVGNAVACPLHGWRFDLRTGESHDSPGERVRVYPVRVVDGRVLVTVPGRTSPT